MSEDQRIVVIGSPGAGKSTLARALAGVTGLPLVHLDRERWLPGWVERDRAEWDALVETFPAADRWIIEGQYSSSLPGRLARATLVVWLDLSTAACLWGVVKRTIAYRNRTRPDMTEGCPERWDATFLWYVLTYRRHIRPATVRLLDASDVPVIRLRSRRERAAFLAHGMARLASSRMERP